jgi:hypothetical protein
MPATRTLHWIGRMTCLLLQVMVLGALLPNSAQVASAAPAHTECCGMAADMATPCHATEHPVHHGAEGGLCCHDHGVPSGFMLPLTDHATQAPRRAVVRLVTMESDMHSPGADWLPPHRPPRLTIL